MTTSQVPPHNLDAEQAVLGCVLQVANSIDIVSQYLSPEDFYHSSNQQICSAILSLYQKSSPIDLITVSQELRQNIGLDIEPAYIAQLTDIVAIPSTLEHYCKIVRSLSVRRQILITCTKYSAECYEEITETPQILDKIQQIFLDLSQDKDESRHTSSLAEMADGLEDWLDERVKLRQPITGVPSGYYDFDKLTQGFQATDLIILAGRPSMGKTALALGIAENAAAETTVGIMSLEMSKKQLGMRYISKKSGIPISTLSTGLYPQQKQPDVVKAIEHIRTLPIHIDDTSGLSLLQLRAKARRMKIQHNIGLLVIDYLQLMNESAPSREQEISNISRGLKGLAKELNIPVIALSQLNRGLENRPNKRPQLSDLRDSGAIEQDADLVMFVYRDEVYNKAEDNPLRGTAEIILAKQRNGPTGTAKLAFRGQTASFSNYVDQGQLPAEI